MTYKVLEVAQHVINHSIDIGKPVTNLKLQKILYYIQASFLLNYREACFEEDIEHWRHGPVIPKVYSEYKEYIDKNITTRQNGSLDIFVDSNANLAVENIIYDENNFYEGHIELMDKVINSYSDIDPWNMVEKTHREDPWINTNSNEIISKCSIIDYFEQHPNRIYGGK